MWHQALIRRCGFYLSQICYRQIQKLRLTNVFQAFPIQMKVIFRTTSSVFRSWDLQMLRTVHRRSYTCATSWASTDYVFVNYISPDSSFPPQIWAQFSKSTIRTTNSFEKFHANWIANSALQICSVLWILFLNNKQKLIWNVGSGVLGSTRRKIRIKVSIWKMWRCWTMKSSVALNSSRIWASSICRHYNTTIYYLTLLFDVPTFKKKLFVCLGTNQTYGRSNSSHFVVVSHGRLISKELSFFSCGPSVTYTSGTQLNNSLTPEKKISLEVSRNDFSRYPINLIKYLKSP